MSTPTVVASRAVVTDTHELTVSTIRIAAGDYETSVFDDSADRRHQGWLIGEFVIDTSSKWSGDRETAMDVHRAALIALRQETPQRSTTGGGDELRSLRAELAARPNRCVVAAQGETGGAR